MEQNHDHLDQTDYLILRELSHDGRASDVSLGHRINLSSTAIARRRKHLEENGVISGYSAALNMEKLGYNVAVVALVELTSQADHILTEFEQEVRKCPSVSFCGLVSGNVDFILIVRVASFNDYDVIYRRELSSLPHVAKIRSSFVLREVESRATPPIVYNGKM